MIAFAVIPLIFASVAVSVRATPAGLKIPAWDEPVPQVAIYPCGGNYGCVQVGSERLAMTNVGRKVGDVEVLARSGDFALVRVPAVPDKSTLVVYKLRSPAGIVAYGIENLGVQHPTSAQIEMIVHDLSFSAYLTSPVEAEAKPLDELATELVRHDPDSIYALANDMDQLYRLNMVDSQVDGKIMRLMEALNVKRTYPEYSFLHRLLVYMSGVRPVTLGVPDRPATERSRNVRSFEERIRAALDGAT